MYCLLKKNMDICWSKKCRSNYFFPIKKRERFFPTKIYYYSTPLFDDPPPLDHRASTEHSQRQQQPFDDDDDDDARVYHSISVRATT